MELKHNQFEPPPALAPPPPCCGVGQRTGMKTLLSSGQLAPYKEAVSVSEKVDEGHAALLM